jgi:hypothetical protein
MYQSDGPGLATDDFAGAADWYLTVRCSNPKCARLIAFQKARFGGGNPHLRLAVTGKLSVAGAFPRGADRAPTRRSHPVTRRIIA